MATYDSVFERKEIKYRLSAGQVDILLAGLQGRMVPDQYGSTPIVSMYFDTPEHLLIERSLDKPLYKEKLRLRSYGMPAKDSRVFIEIKKKYKGIVYKRRVALSYAAARAYLGGAAFEDACRRYPLPDAAMHAETLGAQSRQIAREIDSFIMRYEPLEPSMLIVCSRTAYLPLAAAGAAGAAGAGAGAAGGEGAVAAAVGANGAGGTGAPASADARPGGGSPADAGLRITFDTALTYRDMRHAGSAAQGLIGTDEAIVEVKNAGPLPLWLLQALAQAKARPSSFSKYGEAYRACAAVRMPQDAQPRKAVSPKAAQRAARRADAAACRPATIKGRLACWAQGGQELGRQALHAARPEELAPAGIDMKQRSYRAPLHAGKKGGRCA